MDHKLHGLRGILSMPQTSVNFQEKTVVPADKTQVVTPDSGHAALSKVTVAAIPKNYGRVSFNGYELLVE